MREQKFAKRSLVRASHVSWDATAAVHSRLYRSVFEERMRNKVGQPIRISKHEMKGDSCESTGR